MSWRRLILAFGLGLVFATAVASVSTWLFVRALRPVATGEVPPVAFEVAAGAHLGGVARKLEADGLVRSATAFRWLSRLRGDDARLHVGQYELSAAQSSQEILNDLVTGRIKTWEVVLPEGLRVEEVAARLSEVGLADPDAFTAFALDPDSAEALGVAGPTLEGYLFPETYRLPRGLSTEEVADALVAQFRSVWTTIEPLAAEKGMDQRAVVTLASIVEKETGAAVERPRIAGVFHNRLDRGMRLESDPTVIYGIPDFDGNLRRVHLEDGSNVYNTYKIPALPPGPIANPGAAALRAVVEPEATEYLFFVSRNDGTHIFSKTYREHEANVDRFQRRRKKSK